MPFTVKLLDSLSFIFDIAGRKEFLTTCGNDGNWEPAVNFQCLNLFEAERAVMGRGGVVGCFVTLVEVNK